MSKKGPLLPELAPLIKWLADIESVLTGKAVLTYRDEMGIQHVCAPTGLFEREHDVRPSNVGCNDPPLAPRMVLWVVGRDPACNCVSGGPLHLCTVAKNDRAREA
jgi:hypothetical protein